MDLLRVFIKLLPFSGTEPSDWIITIAVAILLLIFLYQVVAGIYDYKSKKNILETFDDHQDEYFNRNLQNAWQNFQKHLIKTPQNTYYRIYDSSQFFNLNTVFDRIGKSHFSHISSLLLSLGLLGTFVGLFYGLVQLNLEDTEKLQSSMNELIHASGAKFASSIWGLGLSIGFSIYEKKMTSKASHLISQFQNKLNDNYPLAISEQTLLDLEHIDKAHYHQNKNFFKNNENLLTSIHTSFDNHQNIIQSDFNELAGILNKNHSESQTALKGIFDILANQYKNNNEFQNKSIEFLNHSINVQTTINDSVTELKKTLDNKLEEITSKQQEQLDTLNGLAMDMANNLSSQLQEGLSSAIGEAMNKEIQTLVTNIGGSPEDSVHNAIKEMVKGTSQDFSKQLKEVLDDFMKEMKKSTGADADSIKNTITNISSVADTLNNDVGSLNEKMTTLLDSIQNKIDQQATKNEEAGNSIKESAEQAGDDIVKALKPIQQTLDNFNALMTNAKTHLENLPTHLQAFETATGNLKDSAQNTLSASDRLESSSTKLENVSNQFTSTVNQFNQGIDDVRTKLQLIPSELDKIVKSIEQISNNAGNTYDKLSKEHNNLLTKNNELMTTWITALEGYQGKTDEFVEQVLGDMQNHIKQILQEVENGLNAYKVKSDEHIQSNLAEYDRMVKVFIEKANGLIDTTFANFDGSLGNFATELSGAIADLNDTIEVLNEKLRGR
ncbi:poly(R)-hydroxyalkanoic acid synthase subunit PhaE [Moraxella oblonga]|uniref:poly(R)-hydroxyalkanoic acid synthase subunit PhaE n=1 Tax=Moraxella oblonga TaxID=200413 RepID=UPI0014702B64|nr:poly(R)-hydroxyalkanoic acid synthase subunit PhaE [Moraxella oblonga]